MLSAVVHGRDDSGTPGHCMKFGMICMKKRMMAKVDKSKMRVFQNVRKKKNQCDIWLDVEKVERFQDLKHNSRVFLRMVEEKILI